MLIKIEFEKGGVFVAELFEEKAPQTSKIIAEKLPFEYEFLHSATSGQAIIAMTPDLPVPKENQRTIAIYPGSLCFLVKEEIYNIPNEIYITTGDFFVSRGYAIDYQQPINVFGQIKEKLDELDKIGSRILMKGTEKVKFSLMD